MTKLRKIPKIYINYAILKEKIQKKVGGPQYDILLKFGLLAKSLATLFYLFMRMEIDLTKTKFGIPKPTKFYI